MSLNVCAHKVIEFFTKLKVLLYSSAKTNTFCFPFDAGSHALHKGLLYAPDVYSTFSSHPGQQVSIFNFGATGLRSTGLRYPIRDFTNWWEGTLNEAISEEFTILCTGYYLVFMAYI